MSTAGHGDLSDAAAAHLVASLGASANAPAAPTSPASTTSPATAPPPAPPLAAGARARRALVRAVKPVVWPVARRVAAAVSVRVAERLAPSIGAETAARVDAAVDARVADALRAHLAPLAASVESAQATVRAAVTNLDLLAVLDANAELFAHGRDALHQLRAVEVNLESLKAEVRAELATLDRLGRAIAPDAGIEAAAARLAEQREEMSRLDRAVRQLRAGGAVAPTTTPAPTDTPPATTPAPAATPAATTPSPTATPAATTGTTHPGFDYVAFERRFRGDPAEILATQRERYLELLRPHAPVVDIGCGRGELLAMLTAAGIACRGVEPDPGMADEARARGLRVDATDALTFLSAQPEGSLGAVVSMHVAEHLTFDDLLAFIDLSFTRLAPGGLFVAETPNPTSLVVLGNSFILDPSHVWPLHPSLMTFLAERAGFGEVEVRFHAPADYYRMPRVEGDDLPSWVATVNTAIDRLNQVLFGPQEYAVIARKGG